MLVRGFRFTIRWFLALIGMVLVLFEEVLWGLTGGIMRFLGRFAPVARVEDRIRRLPPILALPLFVLPWLVMLPVKLGALWLIAMGKVIHGTLLFIGGEAFGVAFLARLYELCRPALHRWRWFVIIERVLLRWTQWAHDILHRLPFMRAGRAWSERHWRDLKQWMGRSRARSGQVTKDKGVDGAGRN
jgi:hypothetical protein